MLYIPRRDVVFLYQRSFEDLQRDVAVAIRLLPSEGLPESSDMYALYQDILRIFYTDPCPSEAEGMWAKAAILYGLTLVQGKHPNWNGFVLQIGTSPRYGEVDFQPKTQHGMRFYALLLVNLAIGYSACHFPEHKSHVGQLAQMALMYFEYIGHPPSLNRWVATAWLMRAYGAWYAEQRDEAKKYAEQAISFLPESATGLLSLARYFMNEEEEHRPRGLRRLWCRTTEPHVSADNLYHFSELS